VRPRCFVAHELADAGSCCASASPRATAPRSSTRGCTAPTPTRRLDLARIGALAREHATPTLFVIHPVFERDHGFADAALAPVYDDLAREARTAGLAIVDLRDAYAQHPRAELQQSDRSWFDPWHPSALGHAVAAEAILRALREMPPLGSG
jgi:lysophospholipase L1-like esterase